MEEADTVDEPPDSYLLQFWPGEAEPDRIVRQHSDVAAYWRNLRGGRDCVVRVDYSLGSVRHRRNNTRIVWFTQEEGAGGAIRRVRFAPPGGRRTEQYRSLLLEP